MSYSKINNYFNEQSDIRLASRLDFSNIYLKKEDFYNTYNNLILQLGQNGATSIELSNLQLYEYIKKKYPLYKKFILSSNAWQIIDLTPEMINVICENEDFNLISLPGSLIYDKDFLSQIKNKNKIEITVNQTCIFNCPNLNDCVCSENKFNYNFSEQTVKKTCPKKYDYYFNNQIIQLSTLKEKFEKNGINHFKLQEFPSSAENDMDYFLFLMKYFIKDEFHEKMIEEFLKFGL